MRDYRYQCYYQDKKNCCYGAYGERHCEFFCGFSPDGCRWARFQFYRLLALFLFPVIFFLLFSLFPGFHLCSQRFLDSLLLLFRRLRWCLRRR